MIKQNHFSTVTALFVVVLGVGMSEADASSKQHKKTHDVIYSNNDHRSVTKNIRVKDKNRLSKNTCKTDKQVRYKAVGTASWYGFESGNKTACGANFNPYAMTAAHRKLPFGTKVRVTNLDNNKSVIVTINDRGPFHGGRLIDLSMASAKKIGMKGTTDVKIETL